MTKRRLGELLQAEGLITEDQVRAALEEQRKSNLFLGEALVKLGFVSEEAIAHTIVQQFSLPFLAAMQCNIAADVLNIFPESMYYEYQFIAVDRIGKVLLIAGAGLMNHDVLDELERLSGCRVCQYVSTWKDIRSALEKHAKDLKKGQASELSSLGSMLLDSKMTPMPVPRPAAPVDGTAAVAAAAPPAPPPPAAPASPTIKPTPTALRPAATASALAPGAQVTGSPPTASVRPVGAQPTATVGRSALSGRVSALATPRPAAAKSSQTLPRVPTAMPNATPAPISSQNLPKVAAAAAPPAEAQTPGEAPAAPPKPGPGLLGLFKKSS